MRISLMVSLLILTLLPLGATFAAPHPGKALHDAHCMACHGPEKYSAEQRKIDSKPALIQRVTGCSKAAGSGWSEAELRTVIDYLDQTYYHFK